jgi:ferredoxin
MPGRRLSKPHTEATSDEDSEMRVKVDGQRCSGQGRCWALAPSVYEPDDGGFNSATGSVIDVAAGEEDAAIEGVDNCPEGALTVVD